MLPLQLLILYYPFDHHSLLGYFQSAITLQHEQSEQLRESLKINGIISSSVEFDIFESQMKALSCRNLNCSLKFDVHG